MTKKIDEKIDEMLEIKEVEPIQIGRIIRDNLNMIVGIILSIVFIGIFIVACLTYKYVQVITNNS